jgi:glutaconate CoA-transferase subunit B
MMVIAAAREIKNTDIIFCGTGLPIVAACAAKLMHAPRSIIFFETGAIDPFILELPMFVADSRVMVGSSINSGLIDALSILENEKIVSRIVTILGAGQIDKFGNLNSTCIGEYFRPRIRLPGSGGAGDGACLAGKTIVFMKHERTRFVEKLDYLTSPGWLEGWNSRKKAGLIQGGPIAVITNLGVMRFNQDTKEMYIAEYYPGNTPEKITTQTNFAIDGSKAIESMPPSEKELNILRTKVDPQRLILESGG